MNGGDRGEAYSIYMETTIKLYTILVGRPKERKYLGPEAADEGMILKLLVPRSRMMQLYLHSQYVFMAWC
jgi:hypothetical protein